MLMCMARASEFALHLRDAISNMSNIGYPGPKYALSEHYSDFLRIYLASNEV